MGWYMMALVDTLPYYPANDPGRAELLTFLRRTAKAVVQYQDPKSGLWYQVLNKSKAPGNYLESSASCMFTYALAKGVRLGYLPVSYEQNAERAWRGIQTHFLKIAPDGGITLTSTVQSIGLGGRPYRDGSYHYYVSSPVVSNDPKGIGALLLAANEMEIRKDVLLGRGQTALLDGWYNSQKRPNAAGQMVEFHYKWNDLSNEGYSIFGHIFRLGLKLYELGNRAVEQIDLRARIRPHFRRLAAKLGETVHLGVLQKASVIYLEKIEPNRRVCMTSKTGSSNPAYCTSMGKAMLAHLPEDVLEQTIAKIRFVSYTPKTISSREELMKSLERVRRRGYAIDDEEIEMGVRCVGAPVLDDNRYPIAAVSISGPSARIRLQNLPSIAEHVMRCCEDISSSLRIERRKKSRATSLLLSAQR